MSTAETMTWDWEVDDSLVQRHQRAVWRFLRWLGADPALADDLTQETFVRLLLQRRDRRDLPSDGRPLRAWLCTTARNLFRTARGSVRHGVPLDDGATLALVFERHAADGGDASLAALDDCLAELAPRARTAIDLHYRHRLEHRELAAALGMKSAGVKGLLRRIRATLAHCIERRRNAP